MVYQLLGDRVPVEDHQRAMVYSLKSSSMVWRSPRDWSLVAVFTSDGRILAAAAPEAGYESASSNTASGAPNAVTRRRRSRGQRSVRPTSFGRGGRWLRARTIAGRVAAGTTELLRIQQRQEPKATITISIGKVSNPTGHNIGIPASRMPRPTSLATKIG